MNSNKKHGISGHKSGLSSSSLPNKKKAEDKSKNNPLNEITGTKIEIFNENIKKKEENKIVNSEKDKIIMQNEIENFNKNEKPYKTDIYNLDDRNHSKYYKNKEKIKGIYGFKNNKLSYNCFMNSSLQNLFHCNHFITLMRSINKKHLFLRKNFFSNLLKASNSILSIGILPETYFPISYNSFSN